MIYLNSTFLDYNNVNFHYSPIDINALIIYEDIISILSSESRHHYFQSMIMLQQGRSVTDWGFNNFIFFKTQGLCPVYHLPFAFILSKDILSVANSASFLQRNQIICGQSSYCLASYFLDLL